MSPLISQGLLSFSLHMYVCVGTCVRVHVDTHGIFLGGSPAYILKHYISHLIPELVSSSCVANSFRLHFLCAWIQVAAMLYVGSRDQNCSPQTYMTSALPAVLKLTWQVLYLLSLSPKFSFYITETISLDFLSIKNGWQSKPNQTKPNNQPKEKVLFHVFVEHMK